MTNRVPTHDLDLESSLLGAMITDPPRARATMNGATGEDLFHKSAHQIIYRCIVALDNAGLYVDVGVISDRLRDDGLLDIVGGPAGVLDAVRLDQAPPPESAGQFAERLARFARDRRVLATAEESRLAVLAGDTDAALRRMAHAVDHDTGNTTPATTRAVFVDWPDFWALDQPGEDWLIAGVIARARGHALYAKRKEGKSLYQLWCATQLAQLLDLDIFYFDYEMTLADVRERLEDMGYGPGTDLARFHYMFAPDIAPLDTREGAAELQARIDAVRNPDRHPVVFIDTYGRAVEGKENDNDTTRAFYRWTGQMLKRYGATWVRSDHTGKDESKGQRGGSAKGDDVDVVWHLTSTENGIKLHRDAARMPWVPENVAYTMTAQPLDYVPTNLAAPAGTAALADDLDALHVPLNATTRDAVDILRAAGILKRRQVVVAAMRWRRARTPGAGNQPGTTLFDDTPEPRPEPPGTTTDGDSP